MAGSKQRIEALCELLEHALQGKTLSTERLSTYYGIGSLARYLLDRDIKKDAHWEKDSPGLRSAARHFHELLGLHFNDQQHKQIMDGLRTSRLNAFYTASSFFEALAPALRDALPQQRALRILEPSAGTGLIYHGLRAAFPQAEWILIEKDPLTSRLLAAGAPEAQTINKPYEATDRPWQADLIVSNIPFGDYKVYDPVLSNDKDLGVRRATNRIHNYFFHRALQDAKEGGLVAFITTSSFSDSASHELVRRSLLQRSNLLSAIRLPTSFHAEAGTEVSSDFIVLQKDSQKQTLASHERQFVSSSQYQLEGTSVSVSGYFLAHPESVIGTLTLGGLYQKNNAVASYTGSPEAMNEAVASRLHKDLQTHLRDRQKTATALPRNYQGSLELFAAPVAIPAATAQTDARQTTNSPTPADAAQRKDTAAAQPAEPIPKPEGLQVGHVIVHNDRVGVYTIEEEHSKTPQHLFVPYATQPIGAETRQTIARFCEVRNRYNELIALEQGGNDTEAIEKARTHLNEAYEAIPPAGGFRLRQEACLRVFENDPDQAALRALEEKTEFGGKKTNLFFERINYPQAQHKTPQSIKDALLLSLDKHNRIEPTFMAEALQRDPQALIKEALDEQLIFISEESTRAEQPVFVQRERFLAGNISDRIERIKQTNFGRYDSYKEAHLEQLKEMQPTPLSLALIKPKLGETWIHTNVYERFLEEELNIRGYRILRLENNNTYRVTGTGAYASDDRNRQVWGLPGYGTRRGYKGTDLLEHALNDTYPKPKIVNEKGEEILDTRFSQLAVNKIDDLKRAFTRFCTQNTELAPALEQQYNRLYNSTIPHTHNGSYLNYRTGNAQQPRSYQRDAVSMILQQGGGLVDHPVGAGKSMVMIDACMELKRLGLASKPMFVCLKANINAVHREFRALYPKARLLLATDKDFSPANRTTFFAQVMNKDYSAILLTHEQFFAIPQAPDVQARIVQERIDRLQKDFDTLREHGVRLNKGLRKRMENLRVDAQQLDLKIQQRKNQTIIDFKTMGIDHLFVDESHYFKNLPFSTKHSFIAGLGNPTGSQRAENMRTALRTIQYKRSKDFGATFLTATPISNSLSELYLLFDYLQPSELAKRGLHSFDAWAKTYAEPSHRVEMNTVGKPTTRFRFATFTKVWELYGMVREISHQLSEDAIQHLKPAPRVQLIEVPQTPEQKQYNQALIDFISSGDASLINRQPLSEGDRSALMLLVTNQAKAAAIDLRLTDNAKTLQPGKYTEEHSNKIHSLCENIKQQYDRFHKQRGLQLVFSDYGTPSSDKPFNFYDALRDKLASDYNINPNEIAFAHSYKTQKQRETLIKIIGSAQIRILIGGTKNLGTGLNIQERLSAIHHVDLPWKPADLEQRNGRALRPHANLALFENNAQVDIFFYATKHSLDAYQFDLLNTKQSFIQKRLTKDLRTLAREMDETITSAKDMDYATYASVVSGNPLLLKKAKVERQLQQLTSAYEGFGYRQKTQQQALKNNTARLQGEQAQIQALIKDSTALQALKQQLSPPPRGEKQGLWQIATVDEKQYPSRETLAKALRHKIQRITAGIHSAQDRFLIAKAGPFSLYLHFPAEELRVKHHNSYRYGSGKLPQNDKLAADYIERAIDPARLEQQQADRQEHVKRLQTSNDVLRSEINKPFDKQQQLADLKATLQTIHQQLENPRPTPNKALHV